MEPLVLYYHFVCYFNCIHCAEKHLKQTVAQSIRVKVIQMEEILTQKKTTFYPSSKVVKWFQMFPLLTDLHMFSNSYTKFKTKPWILTLSFTYPKGIALLPIAFSLCLSLFLMSLTKSQIVQNVLHSCAVVLSQNNFPYL